MTTTLTVVLVVAAVILVIEIGLWALICYFRPKFQWLIGTSDESPEFPPDLIRKYVKLSFDPELGWARWPGTGGNEQTVLGETRFSIDENGCRTNPGWADKPSSAAVFGDSFAFCRLVNNNETWPHELSKILNTNVCNFGVGNYGIGQAILRLRRVISSLDATDIVMGVVPETISRIHSYWRHYFEYGNVLAFKPRYRLEGDKLIQYAPAIRTPGEFRSYRSKLEEIRELDNFYWSKFKPDLLQFPFSVRAVTRWKRLMPILGWLLYGLLPGRNEAGHQRAFRVVMTENARISARLYSDEQAKKLLARLVEEFARICRGAGKSPWLLIIPQPVVIARLRNGNDDYRAFFESLHGILPVRDLTETFASHTDTASLYVEGKLGPHPSPYGNKIIAREVGELLDRSDQVNFNPLPLHKTA